MKNMAEDNIPENKYYSAIAYKLKWAKWLMIVFLVAFIFIGMILNSDELNFAGFGYILEYVNRQTSNKIVKTEYQIETDEGYSVRYYKSNIAVLRKSRIDIYDINGKKNFSSKLSYSSPVLKTSDKYILAYDSGTNKMEIFNSFSRLYEYKNDRPVYSAVITDKGNVAYVTEAEEKGYNSAVYVMNSKFKMIYRCMFEKDYIMSADIDDKAERLVVAGFSARDGDYMSRIILYETKSTEPKKKIEISGEQPYIVKLNENGIFAIFENSFRVYNSDGDGILNYDFDYRTIQAMSLTEKLSAVVLNEKTLGIDNRILIFDGLGNIIYDYVLSAEVIDIRFSSDCRFLYFLTRAGLYKIDTEQKTFELMTNEYDETMDCIVYANAKNIFLSGVLKINIIEIETDK